MNKVHNESNKERNEGASWGGGEEMKMLTCFQGTNNRTIHHLYWKTYKDKSKTHIMSDHQHGKHS